MATPAFIGLGSNVGDRRARLDAAIAGLQETSGVVLRAVSAYLETLPIGGPAGQGAYLNAAVAVETTLEPLGLLHALQGLEGRAGRVRMIRWGERPLDLDLLLFGNRIIDSAPSRPATAEAPSDALTVPHPRMALRRFVVAPLAEIAATAIDPITGRSIVGLLANLDRRPSVVAIHDPASRFRDELPRRLVHDLSAIEVRLDDKIAAFGEDRWLVTEWRVSDGPHLHEALEPARPRLTWKVREPSARVLPPTFVVVARGSSLGQFGEVPILEVDPGDLEAIANDVLTTCAATRAGR